MKYRIMITAVLLMVYQNAVAVGETVDDPSNVARLAFQRAAGPIDPSSIEHQRIVGTAVQAAKLKFGGFPNGLIPMEIPASAMPKARLIYSGIEFGGKSGHMVLVPYRVGSEKGITVAVLRADKYKFGVDGKVTGVSSGKEGMYFQPSHEDLPELFRTGFLLGSEAAKDYHVMIFSKPQESDKEDLT